MEKLAADLLAGSQRAVARALSLIENDDSAAPDLLAALYPHTGRAETIGITGPPGAGKSTLVDKLITLYRGAGRRVGVLAVDPTSPFTGGALLGDRVRMGSHGHDAGVFIRSMASRGHLGGLSRSCGEAIQVLDAAGLEVVLVETVGIGQDEVEIARFADTTVVVIVPGLGDEVQGLKAGVMEIADVFVLNKADKPEAAKAERDFLSILELLGDRDGWTPPLVKTVAPKLETVRGLVEAIEAYRSHATSQGLIARKRRELALQSLQQMLGEEIQERLMARLGKEHLAEMTAEIMRREAHPRAVASRLAKELLG
ncbi:MAG: methylmalonyl Co-A mutase-associated GTPase MeaB [Acidobacteriota bacterium]